MKRNTSGAPLMMVHRLNRLSQACKACRHKKRRCDRVQPCSNCSLRQLECEYVEPAYRTISDTVQQEPEVDAAPSHDGNLRPSASPAPPPFASDDIFKRINRLEEAVFKHSSPVTPSDSPASSQAKQLVTMPVNPPDSASIVNMRRHIHAEPDFSLAEVLKRLPPKPTAQVLFDHFASTFHFANPILHILSARDVMEQTYGSIENGEAPTLANLLLLLSIFAGAALAWTPALIGQLNLTRVGIESAFRDYSDVAISVVENTLKSLPPSIVALEGLANLANVVVNAEGFSDNANLLRMYCHHMARSMDLHRLDTAKATEERRKQGYNMVELEVKRRIWWDMVATDWLSSFVESDKDGVYTNHPQQMRVNLPANVDDEIITPSGELQILPLSTPTLMSGFIFRVKLAELCREIVDRMPSVLLEGDEPDYGLVLEIDRKLQDYIRELPVYFRLEPQSMKESEAMCRSRPYIALHRVNVNFGIHARICRLHRMYHLEGSSNPQYAYSRMMCLQSAHRILELRRSMDTAVMGTGLHPARFWKIMQHVYFAALTLATDVSINTDAPDVEDRKAKVMAAYRTLERSSEEAHALVDGIQNNMQTLLATLESRKPRASTSRYGSTKRKRGSENDNIASGVTPADYPPTNIANMHNTAISDFQIAGQDDLMIGTDRPLENVSSMDWGANVYDEGRQVWSDFLAVAPEMEGEDWEFFLDSIHTD